MKKVGCQILFRWAQIVLGIADMQELKAAITDASSIFLVLPDSASDKDYLAALQLQKLAPEKTRILAPEERESFWASTFKIEPPKREFAIIINTEISPVDELRYERVNGTVAIYLTHKQKFDKRAVSLKEHLPPADLVVTMGFSSLEAAERAIESLPRKEPARHIWIEEQKTHKKLELKDANLLGRLIIRSRKDPEADVLWAFVTREDFEKTDASPEILPDLAENLSHITDMPKTALVFWQHGDAGTEGFVWSRDKALLDFASNRLGRGAALVPYVRLMSAANFIEAEIEARKLLREAGI